MANPELITYIEDQNRQEITLEPLESPRTQALETRDWRTYNGTRPYLDEEGHALHPQTDEPVSLERFFQEQREAHWDDALGQMSPRELVYTIKGAPGQKTNEGTINAYQGSRKVVSEAKSALKEKVQDKGYKAEDNARDLAHAEHLELSPETKVLKKSLDVKIEDSLERSMARIRKDISLLPEGEQKARRQEKLAALEAKYQEVKDQEHALIQAQEAERARVAEVTRQARQQEVLRSAEASILGTDHDAVIAPKVTTTNGLGIDSTEVEVGDDIRLPRSVVDTADKQFTEAPFDPISAIREARNEDTEEKKGVLSRIRGRWNKLSKKEKAVRVIGALGIVAVAGVAVVAATQGHHHQPETESNGAGATFAQQLLFGKMILGSVFSHAHETVQQVKPHVGTVISSIPHRGGTTPSNSNETSQLIKGSTEHLKHFRVGKGGVAWNHIADVIRSHHRNWSDARVKAKTLKETGNALRQAGYSWSDAHNFTANTRI